EIDALHHNNTWTLVPLPQDHLIAGSKWVYRIKQNPDGSISKFKSRLVAQGFSQIYEIDSNKTHAPVVKIKTVQTLLAVSQLLHLEVVQIDVDSAYLYGVIDAEIYMEQPEGFEITGPNREELVCKLNKSLYGLKQAGRIWNL